MLGGLRLSTAPDGNGGSQVVPFEVGKIHCCPIVLQPVTRATRECIFLLSRNFSETSLLHCTPQAHISTLCCACRAAISPVVTHKLLYQGSASEGKAG